MKFGHALAYTFSRLPKGQMEKTDRLTTPGAGTYNPKKNSNHGPKWKFGTEARGKRKDNGNPGPGTYMPQTNVVKKMYPQYSFASKVPKTLTIQVDTEKMFSPGPGSYNPVLRSTTPHYSMGQKNSFSFRNDNPGPGKYEVKREITVNTLPSYKFSTSRKKGLEIESSKGIPGPGSYNTEDKVLKRSQPNYSFGRQVRTKLKFDSNPAPNQYKVKEYIGKEGPKISMSKKIEPSKSESCYFPGPGQYKLTKFDKYLPTSPSFGMGKSNRDDLYKKSDNPGPGEYDTESKSTIDAVKRSNPSWVMGTEKKGSLHNERDLTIPGVGTYNVRRKIGTDGPKFSMGAKTVYHHRTGSDLGPGQYLNTDSKITHYSSPSWKVGTSSRDDKIRAVIKEDLPGPGKYNPNLKNKKKAPGVKFGTSKRNAEKGKFSLDNPGPGSYHIPCSIVDVNDYIRGQGEFNANYRYI
ncbi:MAG: hypothetical protein MJ252_27040 [archaeon]|nr:hypothetical protein [archaeon]